MSSKGLAYKIVSKATWDAQVEAHGCFLGTPLDLSDGFIHLSAPGQVKETAQKWFKGQRNLIMIAVDLYRVSGDVKWEPSRNNQLFPHIYGAITRESAKWIRELSLAADGETFHYPSEFEVELSRAS